MRDATAMALLKRVSRSFYLSVRLLPAPMRRGICTGYLLARASDTLADAQKNPALLDGFAAWLDGGPPMPLPKPLPGDDGERELLARLPEVIDQLDAMPSAEAALVRQVVATILGGQRLDMQRFAEADGERVVTLADAAALDDYAWRVAGCVGLFWTRLGFLVLGRRFSTMPEADLEALGINFGKGLQLVNILRDVSADLAVGRGYLPVSGADDLPTAHAAWEQTARRYLADGLTYAAAMNRKRLHIAVSLPARIGIDTLDAMRAAGPAALRERVKIPRNRVWRHLAAAWKSSLSRGGG